MAALIAILRTLARVARREFGTFLSVRLNNFFLFGALLAYTSLVSGMKPVGSLPFFLLLGLLMLFPMTSDHLGKIPSSRWMLWPLSQKQRLAIRLASLGLTPVVWLPVLVVATTRQRFLALVFLMVVLVIQVLSLLGSELAKRMPRLNPYRNIPQLPGALGGIIRHDIRQIMTMLDFYAALLLSILATAYRLFSPRPEAAAFPVQAMLVGMALSTYAQAPFGLDSASGLTRYRLLPLRGWQILFAKDAAFLMVLFVLVLPLSVGPGITFGLTAIAVGRYPALVLHVSQHRWRFTGGSFRFGVLQVVVGAILGFAEYRRGAWFFLLAAALYLLSLYAGGVYWDLNTTSRFRIGSLIKPAVVLNTSLGANAGAGTDQESRLDP